MADLQLLQKEYAVSHARKVRHGGQRYKHPNFVIRCDLQRNLSRIQFDANNVERLPVASLDLFAIDCESKEGRTTTMLRATAKLNATARDRHGGVDVSSI
jgi:hypothetical protein